MKYVYGKVLAFAIISGSAVIGASSSAHADCGLIGCIVNDIVPGAGDALDDWNREFSNRQSDHSVWNQVMHPQMPKSAFRSAGPQQQPQPQPQLVMGNYCATQFGVFGPGPFNPVGSRCFAWNAPGQVVQGW
ncbi:hypothetical protein GCM10007881_62820 [Mesorhizobium huakuii]|uniref:hypothetical protein n=1 Tax=Mesorhizobium huakuii TaxID=28104 RepID=UPI00235CB8A9|nr:hypothetical protein [Mesorhizobium huakuii]GLQ82759.1 hypothetical protein GCM10007881_62820 [Mesorhizobium huakuii]